MNRTTKLKTKILICILLILIATFLSACITWILIQIFSRTPEEILNFSLYKVFACLFENIYALQVFFLLLLIFSVFFIFSVIRMFNLNNYLSKTYKVTPDILIPMPVGKEQTQQGSSWWLEKEKLDENFGKFTFDPENEDLKQILAFSKENKNKEKQDIEKIEKEKELKDEIKKIEEALEENNEMTLSCFLENTTPYFEVKDEEEL